MKRDKLGFGGESAECRVQSSNFNLKPVGEDIILPHSRTRGIISFGESGERFNPRLPCVKGAVAAKPIVFKGFVRD